MAKFLKVETVAAGKSAVLIPIDGIVSASVGNSAGTTTLTILMNDPGAGYKEEVFLQTFGRLIRWRSHWLYSNWL